MPGNRDAYAWVSCAIVAAALAAALAAAPVGNGSAVAAESDETEGGADEASIEEMLSAIEAALGPEGGREGGRGGRGGPAEDAARRAWGRIERKAGARKLSPAAAKALLQDFAAFEKRHGRTALAASAADEIDALKARAEAVLARTLGRAASGPSDVARHRGLVGHWRFDEGKGNVTRDWSGSGCHGRLEGARWAEGGDGGALRFDGSGEVLVSGSERYELGAADFTIAAWTRAEGDGAIVAKAPPTGKWARDAKALFVRGGRLHFDSGWVGTLASKRRIDDGKWHHVAVTFADATDSIQLYVDGIPDGSRVLPLRPDVEGHVLKLGFASPNFPRPSRLTGLMDGVRIYGRTLSAAEVSALFEKGAAWAREAGARRPEGEKEPEGGVARRTPARNAALLMTFDQGTVVYKRREGSWYALDLSGRKNHGRICGSFAGEARAGRPLVYRTADDVPAEYDMALVLGPSRRKGDFAMYFAGKAGYIEVKDDLNSFPVDISVGLLARDVRSRQYVVSSDRPGRNGTGIGITGGRFEIDYHDGFTRSGRVHENRWVNVQLVYTEDTITLRVAGREVGSFSDHRGNRPDGRDDYYIGRHNQGVHMSFNGVIDQVCVRK